MRGPAESMHFFLFLQDFFFFCEREAKPRKHEGFPYQNCAFCTEREVYPSPPPIKIAAHFGGLSC